MDNSLQSSPPAALAVSRSTGTRGWIIWLAVCLSVFACLPDMTSGNYLPKIFWVTVTIAIGLMVCFPLRPNRVTLTSLGIVWMGYMAWALLSLAWAVQPRVGMERWLVLLLLPALAYLLAKRMRFWESDRFWFWFCLVNGVVALIGIMQYSLPELPVVHWFPGTAVPRGTMGHRNYASMYFMVTLPFVVRYYFHDRQWKRWLALVVFCLGFSFLLLARTRGAWIGAAIGLLFFLIAGGGRKLKENPLRSGILLAGVLIGVILAISARPMEEMSGKARFFDTTGKLFDPRGRLEFWKGTLGITNPLIGCGFGNYPIVATPHMNNGQVKTLNWEVHNDYLQAYVDLGLPGVLLFCLAVFVLLRLAWKNRKNGLSLSGGMAVTGLAIMQFTTFTSEKVSTVFWIAGVAAILNRQSLARKVINRNIPGWISRAGNITAICLLIFLAVVMGYTIRGDIVLREVQESISRVLNIQWMIDNPEGHSEEEIDYLRRLNLSKREELQLFFRHVLNRVIPLIQFDANMKHIYSHQLAGCAARLNMVDIAGGFASCALTLHPTDRESLAYLAQIALSKNDFFLADKLLRRGVKTFGYNPYLPYFGEQLTTLYQRLGYPEQASAIREKMEANRVVPPSKPSPANRLKDVPVDFFFDWEDCNGAVSYELYLWRVREQTPERPIAFGLNKSEFHLEGETRPGTTYIWRVDVIGKYKEEKSELFFFRTEEKPE